MIVDDASYVLVASCLVDAVVTSKRSAHPLIKSIVDAFPNDNVFSLYGKMWMASKYFSSGDLVKIVRETTDLWSTNPWLGRLVGGLYPLFAKGAAAAEFRALILGEGSEAAMQVHFFHEDLQREKTKYMSWIIYLRIIRLRDRAYLTKRY